MSRLPRRFASSVRCSILASLASLALLACSDSPATDPGTPAPSPTATPQAPPVPQPPQSAGPAVLTLSRQDVVFNAPAGRPASDTFDVDVGGGRALAALAAATRYADGGATGWLVASLDRRTTPARLRLTAATAELPAGAHSAVVMLSADGVAPESLTVTARVTMGATIGLSAARICFGSVVGGPDPAADDVRITSVDGSPMEGLAAAIEYAPGGATGWLAATLDRTSAPARLWLRGSTGALPAGTHTASVRVTSTSAGAAAQTIVVTFTVSDASPSRLDIALNFEGPGIPGGIYQVWTSRGTICGPNCYFVFESGLGSISLSPNTDYGARFLRWEGACTGRGDCTVTFTQPGSSARVVAVFGMRESIVTVLFLGAGASGKVDMAIPEVGVSRTCEYVNGASVGPCEQAIEGGRGTVTLRATPAAGSVFVGWEDYCSGSDPVCRFSISQGGTYPTAKARFATASGTYRLAAMPEVRGLANGTVVGSSRRGAGAVVPRIDCRVVDGVTSGTCEADVPSLDEVTLRASVRPGTDFSSFGSGASNLGCFEQGQADSTCRFIMYDNYSVQARFEAVAAPTPILRVIVGPGVTPAVGRVTAPGIDCRLDMTVQSGDCEEVYPWGTRVRLVPSADPPYRVSGFGPCDQPSDCTVLMDRERTVSVNFTIISSRVEISVTGTNANGVVTATNVLEGAQTCVLENGVVRVGGQPDAPCAMELLRGSGRVDVTAEARPGSVFEGWSGACSGAGACVVDVTAPGTAVSLGARFARVP